MPWASVVVGRRRAPSHGPETAQRWDRSPKRLGCDPQLFTVEPREGAVRFEVGVSPVDDVDAVLWVGREEQTHKLRGSAQRLEGLVQLFVLLRRELVVQREEPV